MIVGKVPVVIAKASICSPSEPQRDRRVGRCSFPLLYCKPTRFMGQKRALVVLSEIEELDVRTQYESIAEGGVPSGTRRKELAQVRGEH